ncbi:MAG TPA: hypothetical protein VGG72_20055 [Bryobacteraceae bacterium]
MDLNEWFDEYQERRVKLVVLRVEFPCIWTDYYSGAGRDFTTWSYQPNRCKPDPERLGGLIEYGCHLSFGNPPDSFRHRDPIDYRDGYVPRDQDLAISRGWIPLESDFGQALAAFAQDEPVVASGRLFCTEDGGCEVTARNREMLFAKLTSIRALKTGAIARVPDDTPTINDQLTKTTITFYSSDEFDTLLAKAQALVAQKPSADRIKLMELLQLTARCRLASSPQCSNGLNEVHIGLYQKNTLFTIYVPGDLPSLRTVAPDADQDVIPNKEGKCATVNSDSLRKLDGNVQRITELLRLIGTHFVEPANPPPLPQLPPDTVCKY